MVFHARALSALYFMKAEGFIEELVSAAISRQANGAEPRHLVLASMDRGYAATFSKPTRRGWRTVGFPAVSMRRTAPLAARGPVSPAVAFILSASRYPP